MASEAAGTERCRSARYSPPPVLCCCQAVRRPQPEPLQVIKLRPARDPCNSSSRGIAAAAAGTVETASHAASQQTSSNRHKTAKRESTDGSPSRQAHQQSRLPRGHAGGGRALHRRPKAAEARAARACAPFGQRLVALLTLPLVLRACLCLLSLVACLSRLFPVARPSCLLFSPSPLFLDGLSVSRCYPRLFLSRARALCGLSGPQRHPAQEPRVRHEHCYACQLWQRQQLSAHPTPV